jgi:hypothetical protein
MRNAYRYRSPKLGNTVTTNFPAFSGFDATRIAATTLAPLDIPAKLLFMLIKDTSRASMKKQSGPVYLNEPCSLKRIHHLIRVLWSAGHVADETQTLPPHLARQ